MEYKVVRETEVSFPHLSDGLPGPPVVHPAGHHHHQLQVGGAGGGAQHPGVLLSISRDHEFLVYVNYSLLIFIYLSINFNFKINIFKVLNY